MEDINITSDAISNELLDLQLVPEPIVTIQQIEWEIDQLEKSDNSKNNIKSALKKMVRVELIDLCDVKSQFSTHFDRLMFDIKQYVNDNGVSKSWPSFLNDIQFCVNNLLHFDVSDASFGEALLILLRKKYGNHLSRNKLAKLVNNDIEKEGLKFNARPILSWISIANQKKPSPFSATTEVVLFLDRYLGANGSLSAKANLYCKKIESNQRGSTESLTLPDKLRDDVRRYVAYKKDGVIPTGHESHLFKQLKSKERMVHKIRINNKKWQTSSRGNVTSEGKFISFVNAFARYIQVKHHALFKNLSLSDFFDDQLLSGFFSYRVERGLLASTGNFFVFIISECKSKSFTSVYLSHKDSDNHTGWLEHLSLLKIEISEYIDFCETREKLQGGRHVEWILSGDIDPNLVCNNISRTLYQRTKAVRSDEVYCSWRVFVMFEILRVCPMRVGNYEELNYKGKLDPSAIRSLIKVECAAVYWDVEKQVYSIFVHKKLLKNRTSSNISNIYQPMPHLKNVIDAYLEQRDKQLKKLNIETTDFSLIAKGVSKEVHCTPLLGSSFSDGLYKAMKLTYPENDEITAGINPHAMRHLDASIYLRDNPENYTGLATLLMDDLQTVINTYAKRDDKGNAEKISNWANNNYKSPFDEE